nr:cyclin-dependent kinase inhibitor 1 [Agelaius phoeniceus]
MLQPLLKSPKSDSRCVSPLWAASVQTQPSWSHLGCLALPWWPALPCVCCCHPSPITRSAFPAAATMPLSQSRAGQSPCSTKACRNLFGPVDHEQLQQDFEDQMKQQLEEAQQRWNFNFETETPLEGPFKWERMLVAEQPPQQVHSLVRAVISSDSRSSLATRVPPKERVGRICPEEAQQSSKVCRAGSLQKRGQTTIKDFYSAKRRIVPARPRP